MKPLREHMNPRSYPMGHFFRIIPIALANKPHSAHDETKEAAVPLDMNRLPHCISNDGEVGDAIIEVSGLALFSKPKVSSAKLTRSLQWVPATAPQGTGGDSDPFQGNT